MTDICFAFDRALAGFRQRGIFLLLAAYLAALSCLPIPVHSGPAPDKGATSPTMPPLHVYPGPSASSPWVPPLSGPFDEIPRQDCLRSFAAAPDLPGGTLLYTEYVRKGPTLRDYHMGFVIRTWKENQMRPGACTAYYVEGIKHLFDPKLLADGKRVLVKYGEYPGGSSLTSYRFYVLDLMKHTWQRGAPFDFQYPRSEVSLDGRFVAAVGGGNIWGEVVKYSDPITLMVFDTVTGDTNVVLNGLHNAPTTAWTNRGTLLFEAQEPPYRDSKGRAIGLDPAIKGEENVPGIFEEPAMGGTQKLLIRNAGAPVASPDGRWIAFWGWPDSSESPDGRVDPEEQGAGRRSPYLFDVAAKRRYVLKKDLVYAADDLVWTPDSRRLLAMRHDSARSDGSRDCRVLALDVGSGREGVPQTSTLVGTLHAQSGGAFHGSFGSQFRPLRFTKDGKYLMVATTEEKGINPYNYYDYEDSLDALDLKTGKVWELTRMYDDLGMDWTDKPLPDAAWAPKKSGAR